jgi:hypothetical protein
MKRYGADGNVVETSPISSPSPGGGRNPSTPQLALQAVLGPRSTFRRSAARLAGSRSRRRRQIPAPAADDRTRPATASAEVVLVPASAASAVHTTTGLSSPVRPPSKGQTERPVMVYGGKRVVTTWVPSTKQNHPSVPVPLGWQPTIIVGEPSQPFAEYCTAGTEEQPT